MDQELCVWFLQNSSLQSDEHSAPRKKSDRTVDSPRQVFGRVRKYDSRSVQLGCNCDSSTTSCSDGFRLKCHSYVHVANVQREENKP